MNDVLLYFVIKYKGDWELIFKALENKEKIPMNNVFDVKEKVINKYMTIIDDKYLKSLKSVYKPPFLLFHIGNIKLLQNNTISLFGDWKIEEVLKIYNNNNTSFVINLNKRNEQLIKDLYKNNISFICLTNDGIIRLPKEVKKEILHYNNLIISEFYKKNMNVSSDQLLERISIGISKKVLIRYKKIDIDVMTGLEIGQIEGAKMYFYGDCHENTIKNFNLSKIDKISEIFSNKN